VTSDAFELLSEDEATALICSRFRAFVDAGFECNEAVALAVHPQIPVGRPEPRRRATDPLAADVAGQAA
jgi:hypothetical protein